MESDQGPPGAADMGDVAGTKRRPWVLKTPDGAVEFTAWRDVAAAPPALIVKAGATELRYHLRCLNDLHEMLKEHGAWMPLGMTDEGKTATEGTVEAWARSPRNPVKGWYGLKKGARGWFARYVPPIMTALDLAEVEGARGEERMRAT